MVSDYHDKLAFADLILDNTLLNQNMVFMETSHVFYFTFMNNEAFYV